MAARAPVAGLAAPADPFGTDEVRVLADLDTTRELGITEDLRIAPADDSAGSLAIGDESPVSGGRSSGRESARDGDSPGLRRTADGKLDIAPRSPAPPTSPAPLASPDAASPPSPTTPSQPERAGTVYGSRATTSTAEDGRPESKRAWSGVRSHANRSNFGWHIRRRARTRTPNDAYGAQDIATVGEEPEPPHQAAGA